MSVQARRPPNPPDPTSGPVTYVVSGHPRTGTSMMMHALTAGGLVPSFSPEVDRGAKVVGDYVQNPNGFFELSAAEQRDPWFPRRHAGRLIKSQYRQLVGLAPGQYKVVFMMRH